MKHRKSAPLMKKTQDDSKTEALKQEYTQADNHILFNRALRFTILIAFLFGSFSANAQIPDPAPQPATPQPAAPQPSAPLQIDPRRTTNDSRNNNRVNVRDAERAFEELRALEIPRAEEPSNISSLNEITRNFYRKPTKREMKVLAPSPDHLNKYALFLQQPGTGLIKLNSDSSCAENPTVIVAKENCLQYTMPGAGTAYSFRTESHRIPHLADLVLSKNVLKSDGVMQRGLLVNLGDIPLEDITVQTKGLKYLVDFDPVADAESLAKFDRQLLEGIKADGFIYGLGLYVKNQATYALRSIAYKGKAARSANGIPYNELDFDKRRDILVAFRIVEQEANGNITVVWKILSSKDAPTLKIKSPENQP